MKTKVEKLPKSALKITVTVEVEKVKDAYEHVLEEAVKTTEIEGFRKGAAPKEMVKNKIGVSNLYGDVINHLLQEYYPQALKENLIMPVSNPKVEIKEFDLEKEFEFAATVAIRPNVKMKKYKEALKKRFEDKLKQAAEDNKKNVKEGETPAPAHVHMGSNDVIEVLLENAEVEIADILIEDETNRLMTRLVEQAQTIGLSLEQYLRSQGKTAEELRKDYDKIAEKNLKSEFVLGHIVNEEKIEIGDKEIEETLQVLGAEEMAKRMSEPMEKLYIKSILQKNKLITKLIEEAEGENHHEHHEHQ